MTQVEIRNLSFNLPRIQLELSNITLSSSELTLVCGPRSAGKSLFFKSLSGLLKPDHFDIFLNGRPCPPEQARQNFLYFPPPDAYPFLARSVYEEFCLYCPKLKTPKEKALLFDAVLEELNFKCPKHTQSSLLSSSEKALLIMAFASLSSAPFILLEELCEHLDFADTQTFIQFLLREKEKGKAILVSSYSFDRFLKHLDRVLLMKEGRIIMDALPERALPYISTHGVEKLTLKLSEMSWL